MDKFCRNIESIDSFSQFYDVDFYILLENEKDRFFWEPILERFWNEKKFDFGSVQTCPFINKVGRGRKSFKDFENELINVNGISFIIARDSDYDIFNDSTTMSNRVLTTYGYNIENTLLCPYRIAKLILNEASHLSKTYLSNVVNEIIIFFNRKCEELDELLKWDVAAYMFKNEICNDENFKDIEIPKILGNSSTIFYENFKIKEAIVNELINELINIIPNKFYIEADKKISNISTDKRFLINGHFWTNLMVLKIKDIVIQEKKKHKQLFPCDDQVTPKLNIQENTVLKRCSHKCTPSCINKEQCLDIKHIESQINNIKNTI